MTDLKSIPVPKKYKILLIGDSCIDEYYIGTCDRLNPEAPVPILNIKENFTMAGMAANVEKNLITLGQYVDFITNDVKIKKIRYIDKRSGQHLLRVDDEPKIKPWSGKISILKKNYDAIVISDYNKGFLSYETIEKVIKNFKQPIFIDTKKTDLKRFTGAYIKINFLEYNKLTTEPNDPNYLIVTNGENGAMHNLKHYPASKVEVVDVCGAGDTFLSSLVYGFLESSKMEKAIEFAIKASSLTVQHRGNYSPKYSEILNS